MCLIEVAVLTGQTQRALAEISSALGYAEEFDERAWEPELHRLRGQVLGESDPEYAVRSFRIALELAQSQGSKSLELRAAISLIGLLNGTKKKKAVEAARELYKSFSEGLTTGDLVNAGRLVDQLAQRAV